jgi:ceramide glucosyltransferase
VISIVFAVAFAYQAVALAAAVRHLLRRDRQPQSCPPVSILKPVRGRDSRFYEAIRSHALLHYPQFEILFGVRDAQDPALEDIERLQREFPGVAIGVVRTTTDTPNGKVGTLAELAEAARYETIVVNDSDIRVDPEYLRNVIAPLEQPSVGLVTCLYRATARSFPAAWEALGIASDFAPSTLVAPLVGVDEFGLGSTLVLRAADLQQIGGFAAIADYIADDYQVGKRISQLGKKVWLSRTVVETHLGAPGWRSVWDHQVRWARTIRLSRGAYLGLPVTNAPLWAVVLLAAGHPWSATALVAVRLAVGFIVAGPVLRDWQSIRLLWLAPLRDLWGFAVWCAGATGRTVVWRGARMRLDDQGRITSVE